MVAFHKDDEIRGFIWGILNGMGNFHWYGVDLRGTTENVKSVHLWL